MGGPYGGLGVLWGFGGSYGGFGRSQWGLVDLDGVSQPSLNTQPFMPIGEGSGGWGGSYGGFWGFGASYGGFGVS